MARNIEIKARIESVDALALKAAAIADQGPIEIPEGAEHSFEILEAGEVGDVFTPIRQDYL